MDWKEEPATNQQLLRLQEYGFVPTCPLSVTQAARLIRQYSKHPARSVSGLPPAPQPPRTAPHAVAQDPAPPWQRPAGRLSEKSRMYAYRLRITAEAAQETAAANPDRPGVRADVQSCISARVQFWLDTCRDYKELAGVCEEALEFYRHHGAHFFPPTWNEVQQVLQVLDAAMPGWDKDHPELFYETLKLNFPSMLRQR